jgi:hypothetical protein
LSFMIGLFSYSNYKVEFYDWFILIFTL